MDSQKVVVILLIVTIVLSLASVVMSFVLNSGEAESGTSIVYDKTTTITDGQASISFEIEEPTGGAG
ncbi:MAG: hypothetical protein ABIH59_02540 [archaeon]